MRQRCTNENYPKYHYYGGRGIAIQEGWKESPVVFIEYIESLPNAGRDGYTIDRIDNDGDYEEGNLRWASKEEQSSNQRQIRINNSSGYKGVSFSLKRDKWESSLGWKNRKLNMGRFTSKHQAVFARNRYIVENNLPHKIQQICL